MQESFHHHKFSLNAFTLLNSDKTALDYFSEVIILDSRDTACSPERYVFCFFVSGFIGELNVQPGTIPSTA